MSEFIGLNSVDTIIPNVADKLLDISDLAKLLKFNSSDALKKTINQLEINELFNQDEENQNKRVFYQPFNDKTISDVRSELRIYYPIFNPDPRNLCITDVYVGFDVVIHNSLWRLNEGIMRPVRIIKLILEALNGQDIGVGGLYFNEMCKIRYFNDNFTGYSFGMKTKSR